MKKKTFDAKNLHEVCQLTLEDVVNYTCELDRFIKVFGACTTHFNVKNNKLIVKIHNNENCIKMCLDLDNICKQLGYTNWEYIEVIGSHSDYFYTAPDDKENRKPLIEFWC